MAALSRRDAGKLILASAGGALVQHGDLWSKEMVNSVIRGVQIGAQSYSFRDRPLDACIAAYVACGLGECELYQGHVEPHDLKGERMREWRLNTHLAHFEEVREKFDEAGVLLYAYNYSFRKQMTDAEIQQGFEMALALGVKYITASANVSVAKRVDTFAQKYKITVGFHGHDNTKDPDEFSTPETFARAMEGASEYIGVNLDIGHFTAAGGDAVEYIRQHHDRIVTLHIKDRKKDHGDNVPFGEGDTPIAAVLRLLRDRRWKIPANIEYEYGEKKTGMDTIEEVKKCFAFCQKALES